MAINAYTGLMGSGKSYEVVSNVILDAVRAGRRVVTNIDGIQPEAIADYLVNIKKADPAQLGEVVHVTNDDVVKVGFFPDETKPHQASVVQAGDLVCVDECWQFWGNEHKISEEHMRFFRMHRHYTNAQSGVACDLALMIQDLGTLNRKIRAVVEMTTRTVKLKSIGAPTAYRIELYEGSKTTKRSNIDTFVKRYDKSIFPLYKSYAAGSGNEKPIDRCQNVLTNPRIWIVSGCVLALMTFGLWNTYRFFQPKPKQHPAAAQQSPNGTEAHSTPTSAQKFAPDAFSEAWRYVGQYRSGGETLVVVSDNRGQLRVESPSLFHGRGISAVGTIDGERVTQWSGSSPTASSPLATKESK